MYKESLLLLYYWLNDWVNGWIDKWMKARRTYVFIRRNGSLKKPLIIRNEPFFVVKLRPTTSTMTSKSKTFIHWMGWNEKGKMMKTQRKEIIWWWNSEWHLFSDDQMTLWLWQWQWNGMTMYNEVNLYNTLYNAMQCTWLELS